VFTVAITTVLSVLDGTISNVALPTIAQNLHVSSAAVVWVVNAFQLATTMFIVPLTTYGDIIGFARIYRVGVAIFVIASVFCATAHDLTALIAARSVQGVGAAAILASSQPSRASPTPSRCWAWRSASRASSSRRPVPRGRRSAA
jgi:MFS transporter, DHA2 family, multidrug resistance protein